MKTNSILLSLALFFCLGVQTSAYSGPKTTFDVPKAQTEKIKAKVNSGEFSLSSFAFVENKGQVYGFDGLPHPEVKFSFQQGNTQIFLLEKGIAYQFTRMHYPEGYQEMMRDKGSDVDFDKMSELQKQIRTETFRMDMTLQGANKKAEITTEGRSADYTNFYNRDVLDIHAYSKVTYHNIYPGIDWVIYTKGTEVKYDFIVKPGADPSLIKMQFHHQEDMTLNKDGSFTLKNSLGSITEKSPDSFQSGMRIGTQFILDNKIVSFDLENYNHQETLVIDPALVWATYYGYIGGDLGRSCTTDSFGNVYLSGFTSSNNFIALSGHQIIYGGNYDSFLVKFNTNGVLQWATYYGGSGDDRAFSCVVDGASNVFLAGTTQSSIGIASSGHQNNYGGAQDVFLVKFNNNGVRQWGTYYGGLAADYSFMCQVDASGNVYLSGITQSNTGTIIATAGSHQTSHGGGDDAFLVKFNMSGIRLWGTYYGGSGNDYSYSCSTDPSGNVYLVGFTGSNTGTIIATSGSHQPTIGGGTDAFLVKFNSSGVRQWGTYFGGTAGENGYSCYSDASSNIYVVGYTGSLNGIAAGGHQNIFGGLGDAFLVKFSSSGVMQWGTYYGGAGSDAGLSCVIDAIGNVFLAGYTESTNGTSISTAGSPQSSFGGQRDAFLVKFNTSGIRDWGTYYGASDIEEGISCSVDNFGNIYLAGRTQSGSGIATIGGYQIQYGGNTDAFLVKFCDIPAQPTPINGNTIVCLGSNQSYSISVVPSALSYSWSLPATGWSGVSTTNSITAIVGSSGTISVTALNACGISVPQTISITSNPSPVITVNSASICQGSSFTIAPSGALSYTIEGGVAVVSPSTSSTYTVSGTNSLGCVSQSPATSSVNVFSLPNVSINGTVATICEGEELTLNASGASNYTWSTGANTASINIAPITTITYSIIGTDANGCENTAFFTQAVDPCVGLQELPVKNEQHSVFPNPHDGLFYIETSQSLGVSIYNSLGQLILQRKLNEGKNQINLNEHANGIYFIEINQNGKTNRMKLIKE